MNVILHPMHLWLSIALQINTGSIQFIVIREDMFQAYYGMVWRGKHIMIIN